MKTWLKSSLLAVCLLLASGCAKSPEKQYAEGMEAVLPGLDDWQASQRAYAELLSKPVAGSEGTYSDFLYMCFSGAYYGQGAVCAGETNAGPILEGLQDVMERASAIKLQMGALTPPLEISVAHGQVVACIDQVNRKGSAMVDVIQNGKIINLPAGDECSSLAAAEAKIQDFVEANK